MEEKQKKVPANRIQLVDVVLERKGSQMFEGRRVRSPEDDANIIRDFIGDGDSEKFVVLGLSTKKRASAVASRAHRINQCIYCTSKGGNESSSHLKLQLLHSDAQPPFK